MPSAIRCRSTSPSVGANRYGSSSSHVLPSGKPKRMRYVNCPGRRSATNPAHRPSPTRLHRLRRRRSARRATRRWHRDGRRERPSRRRPRCAPRIACGSWCSPRARRADSSLGGAAWIVVIVGNHTRPIGRAPATSPGRILAAGWRSQSAGGRSGHGEFRADDRPMTDRVTYLGHATVLIELANQRILTDPVLTGRITFIRRLPGRCAEPHGPAGRRPHLPRPPGSPASRLDATHLR